MAVAGDAVAEPDEGFSVSLSGAADATIADASGAGTIAQRRRPARPRDQRRHRHRGQQRHAERRLHGQPLGRLPAGRHRELRDRQRHRRSPAATTPPTSGTLTFAAGVTSQTLSVPVSGDALYEADESFSVALSAASGATIADGSGLGTIANDDAAPALAIDDVTVTEGNSGTTSAAFTVSLSAASGLPVTRRLGDRRRQRRRPRRLRGRLRQPRPSPPARPRGRSPWPSPATPSPSPTRASSSTSPAPAARASPTPAAPAPSATTTPCPPSRSTTSPSPRATAARTNAVFTVSLSAAYPLAVSVNYATANGTAVAGSDYTADLRHADLRRRGHQPDA